MVVWKNIFPTRVGMVVWKNIFPTRLSMVVVVEETRLKLHVCKLSSENCI